ncbi:DNA topoisomerase I [Candidatus Micrarchaeota archaeon]|nr:DNA topoisomerase I [Candidatus Micrarchaeota archaeon]
MIAMKLVVAEKPIAAKRIASILGKPKSKYSGSIEFFEVNDMIIVPLKGHVVDVDFPKEFNNWQNTRLSSLVDAPIDYRPSLKGIEKALQAHANADELIIATDYDREGESIGKEAIDLVRAKNPKIKIKRAKFSALTPSEVKKAFAELTDFDFNLADAADSRREIDLIWGAVLTRYISLTARKLGKEFLSVGRVQTPALALVVDREKEIQAFKPEDYSSISIDCDKNGEKFTALYEEEKIFDKQKAERISSLRSKHADVKTAEKKKVITKPPAPFNTTEFLRSASSMGFQPNKAMSVAESLYMNGLTSYPRTDNTYYPESLNLRDILKKFEKTEEFGKMAKKILEKKRLTPTHGAKQATDHPPIHPVEPAKKSALSPYEWKIYELIVRRFFATLADDCETETVKVVLDYSGEDFVAKGKTILKNGWRDYYPYLKSEEQYLPELKEKERVKASDPLCEAKQTKPKPRYTPSALLKLMDELNLGTKSTRAEILQKLIDRGYIQGKQNFTPSSIAFAVIDALEKHSEEITKPEMTSDLEKEMDEVEKGDKKKGNVVADSRKMLHKALDKLEKNRAAIGEQLTSASSADYNVGKCPQCGGDLRIIRTKKGTRFIGCSGYRDGCRTSFPLPAKGKITPLNVACKDCALPMIRVQYMKKRPFEMCVNHKCPSKANWGKKPEEKED